MGPLAGAAAAPAERKEGAAGCRGAAGVRRRLASASAMSLLCVRGECVGSGGAGGQTGVAEGPCRLPVSVEVPPFPNFTSRPCLGGRLY